MIICFSGTGNSLLVARQLQSHLGGDILMLEGRRLIEPDSELIRVPEGEPVVWVMPVYSWGIPPVVVPFLRRSKLKITPEHSTPHFLVLTCGDDTGYADHQWAKIIGRRGWNPRGSFSVIMPNTYVLMKGFDVDSPDIAAAKLAALNIAGSYFNEAIEATEKYRQIDTTNIAVNRQNALAYCLNKDYPTAIQRYEYLVSQGDSSFHTCYYLLIICGKSRGMPLRAVYGRSKKG